MCACEPESYPSDLTDAQWELIAPTVEPRPGGRLVVNDQDCDGVGGHLGGVVLFGRGIQA